MDVSVRGCRYGNTAFRRQLLSESAGKTETAFSAEMLKTRVSGGEGIYSRLTPDAQKTLEDLKAGRKDLSKVQWVSFCRELRDLGVITQAEFDCTRADLHMVPLISDGRGGVTAPGMKERLNDLYQASQIPGGLAAWSAGDWNGDPLEYLDEWMKSLQKWRDELSAERWPDGEKKYQDLSPLTDQADACQKVLNILQELIEQKRTA